jgi:hypothetical protein
LSYIPDFEFDTVLDFWKVKKTRWPRIWTVVKHVLAIQASSSKSESDFSLAQNLTGVLRTSMSASKVNECLVVRSNHEHLNKWYLDKEAIVDVGEANIGKGDGM